MNNYFKSWKQLKNEFGVKAILDALFASIMYSIFIIVPTVLIYLQIISMFYHLLMLWVILMIVSIIGIAFVQLLLWKKAMVLKKPESQIDFNLLIKVQMVIHTAFIIIIGLLVIFIWIPSLQV